MIFNADSTYCPSKKVIIDAKIDNYEKCRNCLPKDITTLDLSNGYKTDAKKTLEAVLPVVSKLTSVTKIDLSNLEGDFEKILDFVKPTLAQFHSITSLDLYGNALTEVPEYFRRFKNLEILNLGNNILTSLPDWIGELVHLKELSVFENVLTGVVTAGIGKLVNLEILDLSSPNKYETTNGITELPDEITNCTKLQLLDLCGCWKLEKLPNKIGDMSALTDIYLHGGSLTEVPASITNLKNLLRFDVSYNNLLNFPYGISSLPLLKMISLDGNQFELTGTLKKYHEYMLTICVFDQRTDDYPPFCGEGISVIDHCIFVDGQVKL
jgi:Leucine-rich repeat (LRR) protein